MNRLICICFLIAVLIGNFFSASVAPVYTGYTDDGVYYEVFEENRCFNLSALKSQDSHRVNLSVRYDGVIIPPGTYFYSRNYNNEMYSGTLNLRSYIVKDRKTIARYSGNIYRNE